MADNNNNNTIDPANLSEADKIFLPQDLDSDGNIHDYTDYKVRLMKVVPENCVLVKKNRFTGKIKIKGKSLIKTLFPNIRIPLSDNTSGLKILNPLLSKGILVSTVDRTIDYEKIEYLTQDQIMANVDIAIVVHISDPAKYMLRGKEQLNQLSVLIKKLLRVYVSAHDFNDLTTGSCNIVAFDPQNELASFENQYGIKVKNVIFKEVKLPERLQKIVNDAAEEEANRKAQAVKLRAQREKALEEANIAEINATAEAKKISIIEEAKRKAYTDKINQIVDMLIQKGIPQNNIENYLNTIIASEHGNAIFMNGTNQSQNIAMGVAAGNQAARQNFSRQQPLTIAEKLKNDIITQYRLNQIDEAVALNALGELNNPAFIQLINSGQFDNISAYKNLLNSLINPNSQDNINNHQRTK